MHTFVVRVFVAEDVGGMDGLIEEPRSGFRRAFHGGPDLIACLHALVGRGESGAEPPAPGVARPNPPAEGRSAEGRDR